MRELGSLNLTEALDLTLLIREADRRRYERAAVRWLQRFIEERGPTLADLALATAASAFMVMIPLAGFVGAEASYGQSTSGRGT